MKKSDIYIKEVNLIFSILEKIESSWSNSDSLSYIEELKKYKNVLVNITPSSIGSKNLEKLDEEKVQS